LKNNLKSKKTLILSIALLAILATSTIPFYSIADARTYNETIQTFAFLTAIPNPVGVGQTIYLSMFIDKVPPTANGVGGDRWVNMKITVTKPDGTNETLGPFTSDAAGGAPALYTPTVLGNYTFQMSFPGQTLTGDTGTGIMATTSMFGSATIYIGDVYGPSLSKPVTVEVQSEPISQSPENALPSEYWQRPIESFNTAWWTIGGNWLGMAAIDFGNTGIYGYNGNFNPYSQAVMSPHIIWTQPEAAGGQLGGPYEGNLSSNYYTGAQYEPKFAPIVLNGVLYYTMFPGASTNPSGIKAVDLRTGKTLWTINTTDSLICGQIIVPNSYNQYGGVPYLWATTSIGFMSFAPSNLHMYDAVTGNLVLTITNQNLGNSFSGAKMVDGRGDIISYSLLDNNNGTYTFQIWNSTNAILTTMPTYYTGATVSGGSWMPVQGAVIPYAAGFSNISLINKAYNGVNLTLSLSAYDLENQIVVMAAGGNTVGSGTATQIGYQIEAGYSMTTGQQLWIQNRTHTPFTQLAFGSAGNGVYTQYERQTMSFTAYSTKTGEKLWTTEPQGNSLDYYASFSHGVMAYGKLYDWTYGGEVYCYDLTTGKTVWSWSTGSTGLDTPYGVNTFWPFGQGEATIADGVFYVASGHNYGPPLYKNAKIYAINATTGEEIWDFLNFATMSSLPVVDGYMLSFNMYDNQIYAYGKGLTQTTVATAPYANSNSKILITGTVTDQSPGQTCLGIPAAGTPAISDDSMSAWMAYLYEQSPKPTNATGVPVTLTAIDPNGNYQTIGTTTSDANGQFSYTYTPPVPGAYKITASFAGSNSYFSSTAQTTMGFEEAAATAAPTTTAPVQSVADTYFIPAIVAILIVVVIGFALLYLTIKKRP
jgi:outer membrane protein assembly factor BamB